MHLCFSFFLNLILAEAEHLMSVLGGGCRVVIIHYRLTAANAANTEQGKWRADKIKIDFNQRSLSTFYNSQESSSRQIAQSKFDGFFCTSILLKYFVDK